MYLKEDLYSKAFFEVFIIAIIFIWLPSKLLGYIVPFMCLGWFIFRSDSEKCLFRFIFYTLLYILIVCIYILFYLLLGEQFVTQNSILFFITYNSFLFFLILPSNAELYKTSYIKFIKVIKVFILFESLLGIFQVFLYMILNGVNFDFSTGDSMQGTLNLFSFLDTGNNFNNQIFTINLILLLLFYTPYAIASRKGIWVCIIGFIAIIFASVWHLVLSFLIALIIIIFYFSNTFAKIISNFKVLFFLVIFATSLAIKLQPDNFALIPFYFIGIISNESPKTLIAINSVTNLNNNYPWVSIIGLGPGQYSSRAGLIGTNKYFGDFNNPKKLPFINSSSSKAFEQYLFPQWEIIATNPDKYGSSTMSRPFYSLLSIAIEFGYLLFTLIIILLFRLVMKIKKLYNKFIDEKKPVESFYALSCAISILFFFIISFFENYMELPQAIFIGLLLLKYFYAHLKRLGTSISFGSRLIYTKNYG